MAFLLPELDYDYDALEPFFDAKTMEIHHLKHHASYLKKFNQAVEELDVNEKTPEEIFAEMSNYSDFVRNNGGGFYNHTLFWKLLTPNSYGIKDNNLKDGIIKYFGTLEQLKEEFTRIALRLFGSGWVWLIKKNNGELLIISTPNQDNPLMETSPINGYPILCLDIWEHAYYLKYQNNRAKYINAFWNIVNWEKVAELYNHKIRKNYAELS